VIPLQKKSFNFTYLLLIILTVIVFLTYFVMHHYHISIYSHQNSNPKISRPLIRIETTSKTKKGKQNQESFSYGDVETDEIEETSKTSKVKNKNGSFSYSDAEEEHNEDEEQTSKNPQDKLEQQEKDKTSMVKTPQPKLSSKEKRDKNSKKQKKFQTDRLHNYQADWGFPNKHPEKYIEILPTQKIPLKKDRRIVFPDLTVVKPTRPSGPPTGILGSPRALLETNRLLQNHLFLKNTSLTTGEIPLDEIMIILSQQQECYNKPIFLTMATVGNDLYWQLIENFVYTSVKFEYLSCSFVICVSDMNCMNLCKSSYFPCYNYYDHLSSSESGGAGGDGGIVTTSKVSVMEQIAKVKLFYIPMALNTGVNVFMLDLDVGFLYNPKIIIQAFHETPIVDIFVQVSEHLFLLFFYCYLITFASSPHCWTGSLIFRCSRFFRFSLSLSSLFFDLFPFSVL
jgi:hypothetical protein